MVKSSLYFLVLAVNIFSVQAGWTDAVYATKPLLIPLLGWMLIGNNWREVQWIAGALFFSWVGDILLMLPQDLFVYGLGSFLIAHLLYIRQFFGIWNKKKNPPQPLTSLMIALYLAGLIWILYPGLEPSLKFPVIFYGATISIMWLLAIQTGIRSIQIGALLFILSDSLLAINKFYTPLPAAGAWVMGTYGLAQYFIVRGTKKD